MSNSGWLPSSVIKYGKEKPHEDQGLVLGQSEKQLHEGFSGKPCLITGGYMPNFIEVEISMYVSIFSETPVLIRHSEIVESNL